MKRLVDMLQAGAASAEHLCSVPPRPPCTHRLFQRTVSLVPFRVCRPCEAAVGVDEVAPVVQCHSATEWD
eukprot:8322495-Alexandrium_andersonii.AAC.1